VLALSDQLFSMTGLKAARSASSCIVKPLNPEIILMRTSHSLAATLLFSIILVAPDIAAAAGEANPAPPSQSNQSAPMKMKKAKKNTSSADDFLKGYHAAYSLIYDQGDYVGGIAALHALGYDNNADVATLLGYASRKLGRYDDSKFWYERALATDPNKARRWIMTRCRNAGAPSPWRSADHHSFERARVSQDRPQGAMPVHQPTMTHAPTRSAPSSAFVERL
jgi:hypothetical protein